MYKSWIMYGKYNEKYEKSNGLLGYKGLITFDDDAISRVGQELNKSRFRMLYHFNILCCVDTGVMNASGETVMIICSENSKFEIDDLVKSFVDSGILENDGICWDICEDCMAFLSGKADDVWFEINDDYQNWWMQKPEDEREELYTDSLK